MIKYPIGIQTFDKIRQSGYLYVDKTGLIHRLVNENSYVFLSRPRRFGKSLLLSTIEEYFRGNRKLFEGLAMESLENQWIEHPVLRFDFAGASFESHADLLSHLNLTLSRYEAIYGSDPNEVTLSGRFSGIIIRAHQQAGRQVVILVDEYDKAILDCIEDDSVYERNRQALQGFYGVLKSCDAHIRFALLTGVGKFGQLSVFSGLNNIYLLPPASGSRFEISRFIDDIHDGNPDGFMKRLQSLVASISPGVDKGKEVHFQNIMQIIFKMLGVMVATEVQSSDGRCDMIVETSKYVYIMEFKINSPAASALNQIKDKGYARPFMSDDRSVFLIGARFSTTTGELAEYSIEKMLTP